MKKAISLVLALAMCLCLTVPAFAAEGDDIMLISAAPAVSAEEAADALNTLGLLQGTDKGYELDREPTRLEALIMFIRLTAMENEALYFGEYESPFADTPAWDGASQYLGYAGANGLAIGATATVFDPNGAASAQLYLTFVLKALGYTDGDDGTVWDNWAELSKAAGIYDADNAGEGFTRGDMALIAAVALDAKVQGGEGSLADKLVAEGVVNELSLAAARFCLGNAVTATSPLIDIAGMLYASTESMTPDRLFANEITSENMSSYFGEAKLDIAEGIACEPMINASAHSVCLIRLKDGADVEKAKSDIAANADPRKWICVGVSEENVRVESIGNLVVLIMDDFDPDGLQQAFKTLGGGTLSQ